MNKALRTPQSVVGIKMFTATLVPGARMPLLGLKVTLFAKLSEAVQLSDPGLLALDSTWARQS